MRGPLVETSIAAAVFALAGGLCAAAILASFLVRGTDLVLGSVLGALSAGTAGAFTWRLTRGRQGRRSAGWDGCVGAVVGVVSHPLFWALSGLATGDLSATRRAFALSVLSLLFAGIYTVTMGVVASLIIRALVGHAAPGRHDGPGA